MMSAATAIYLLKETCKDNYKFLVSNVLTKQTRLFLEHVFQTTKQLCIIAQRTYYNTAYVHDLGTQLRDTV